MRVPTSIVYPAIATALLCLGLPSASVAQTRSILVETGPDSAFDAVLDGFPGLAAYDGEPDFGGNQLACSLKLLVSEERAMVELPLESLAGVDADDLVSATLVFNVDDVLSTFGPGTEFSGRAGATILVHVYDGDGIVELGDYKRTSRDAHLVETTVRGTITDASLRQTGPQVFEVEFVEDLRALLSQGASHIGFLWRTTDSPTGTSLDDLGEGSGGPAGVDGSRLPWFQVEIRDAAPLTRTPTPTPTIVTTATPTRADTPISSCPGDCGSDGEITVDELVKLVNAALIDGVPEGCPAGDSDGNGQITVDEIVQSVRAALEGCGAAVVQEAARAAQRR